MRSRRTFLQGALLAMTPRVALRAPYLSALTRSGQPASAFDPSQSPTAGGAAPDPVTANDRGEWLAILERVSHPVLEAISRQKLRATMPIEAAPGLEKERAQSSHLEAVGRLLCGLAPWLEAASGSNPAEENLRARYREWSRLAIRYGTDPKSPDALNFGTNHQSLVDAAFLALAIVRAPSQLWAKLDNSTKQNLVSAMQATRKLQPGQNNWVLFSAMIEAFLCKVGEAWDRARVDVALRDLQQWYVGDGAYGDGPHFHWDYYNSFVMQPMLLNILDTVCVPSALHPAQQDQVARWSALREPILARARRYAAIEERLIAPDGTYPPIGRSLAYRFGAFHHLAEMALRHQLPEGITPAQVRCALTAVMSRQIAAPGTFDGNGWLTIGFAGHQPSIGEHYISTGSLYLCSLAWLPLGLPATDPFWSAPVHLWTQQIAWSGFDINADHAINE